jgi:4-amino-4-deoxy-L-arabinose transferase-like glycosyltransferase
MKRDWTVAVFALFCLAVIVLLGKSYESTLPTSDASTHAAIAMSATGQGVIPHFPIASDEYGGHWGKGYNDYPFVFFYLNGWIMRALGPDAWSARILPCLFSVGAVMFTVWLGAIWSTALTGLLAGVILLFSRDFILDAVNCHLDDVLAFFILGSFILWNRKRYFWAAVCAGVGTWFKSPVALLLFPTMAVVAAFDGRIRRNSQPRKKTGMIVGWAVVAIGVMFLIWIVPGMTGRWDLVGDYWVRQIYGTAVQGRGEQQLDLFAFVDVLRGRYLPWSFLLIWGLFEARKREPLFLNSSVAGGIVIVFISLLRYKHLHYYVPAYPFMALIAAVPLSARLEKWKEPIFRYTPVAVLLIGTVLLASPIRLAPESFPAFRKFATVIQSYGSCQDRVLFVEGGQPYGEQKDYGNLIAFYTGRHMVVAPCEGASEAALGENVAWVIVSKEGCLNESARKRFPLSIRYGNQWLLTRLVPAADITDWTVLARELKAPEDCQPAPLVSDRYEQFGRPSVIGVIEPSSISTRIGGQ